METFINASRIKDEAEKLDLVLVSCFIAQFNTAIKKNEFCLNTGLDKIPHLTEPEFKEAKRLAKKQGWSLSQSEDNYQTTSYKLEKIK